MNSVSRQRQLDFLIMYCNLLGNYMTNYAHEFDQDIIDLVRPKLATLRSELFDIIMKENPAAN